MGYDLKDVQLLQPNKMCFQKVTNKKNIINFHINSPCRIQEVQQVKYLGVTINLVGQITSQP